MVTKKTGIVITCDKTTLHINSEIYIRFIQENKNYHYCFVNNGCPEPTLEVLNRIRAVASNRISIIHIERSFGKGPAVRAGVRFLYNMDNIAHIGFIDVDFASQLSDFKKMVNILKKKQISAVYGSRFSENMKNGTANIFRKLFSRWTRKLIGLPISDALCGAKVFNRSVIPIVYGRSFACCWLFDIEIFIRLKKYLGAKQVMQVIQEQPILPLKHDDQNLSGIINRIQALRRLTWIWLCYKVLHMYPKTISPLKILENNLLA